MYKHQRSDASLLRNHAVVWICSFTMPWALR